MSFECSNLFSLLIFVVKGILSIVHTVVLYSDALTLVLSGTFANCLDYHSLSLVASILNCTSIATRAYHVEDTRRHPSSACHHVLLLLLSAI